MNAQEALDHKRAQHREYSREYMKRYRKKHHKKIIARRRELRKRPEAIAKAHAYNMRPEVRERQAKKSKEWLANNLERRRATVKKWWVENRESLLAKRKAYHARPENKERDRRNRLLRKYGNNSLLALQRDNYVCRKCGSASRIAIHHIDWDKTNNELSNLITLCSKCHAKLQSFAPANLRRLLFEEWMKTPLST